MKIFAFSATLNYSATFNLSPSTVAYFFTLAAAAE
jgi:hypothetical protein